MEKDELLLFEDFLNAFSKKNGKGLGEKTKQGILILAKFIETTSPGQALESLQKLHNPYLKERNYPLATYALWIYLKSKGYEDKQIKELATFKKRNLSAITDEEKLAASVLSKKEILYLGDNIKNQRDNLIVRLLYDTGARVSELANARIKDIDIDTGEMQVMGKGRKPRTVYFQKATIEKLKTYLGENEITNPNSLIFAIKPITIWYNLKKYGQELLDRDLHPHMFRHSRLQHMADEGVDSFAIKSYAGHSDIGTTQIYIKNSKFQRKLAFTKAGDIWKEK
ncbi:MAG TPA: tyrosine-type recombinase/integrase [Candidatus Nanoarchaeia archaeon]|nr:tyrosine-type recombinase/integrase [Candidatus Nanoarchaeia archaeon]